MAGDSLFNKHAQNLLFENHDFLLKKDQVRANFHLSKKAGCNSRNSVRNKRIENSITIFQGLQP